MESMIDFFRFREREDFIAFFPGRVSLAMLSPRAASVNRLAGWSSSKPSGYNLLGARTSRPDRAAGARGFLGRTNIRATRSVRTRRPRSQQRG